MEEKLSFEIKRYLEKELRDYQKNKKELEELRLNIMEESPSKELGMPSSPNRGQEQLTPKVYKLMTNVRLKKLAETVDAIDRVIVGLDDSQLAFFDMYYKRGFGRYKVCMNMPLSEATYFRYKNKIIDSLAEKLGYR
jgi:RinA family phage transcriptional activator